MKNELLTIGPLTVYGYGFMIAVGLLCAWYTAEKRARKLHLAYEHVFYLVVLVVPLAVLRRQRFSSALQSGEVNS